MLELCGGPSPAGHPPEAQQVQVTWHLLCPDGASWVCSSDPFPRGCPCLSAQVTLSPVVPGPQGRWAGQWVCVSPLAAAGPEPGTLRTESDPRSPNCPRDPECWAWRVHHLQGGRGQTAPQWQMKVAWLPATCCTCRARGQAAGSGEGPQGHCDPGGWGRGGGRLWRQGPPPPGACSRPTVPRVQRESRTEEIPGLQPPQQILQHRPVWCLVGPLSHLGTPTVLPGCPACRPWGSMEAPSSPPDQSQASSGSLCPRFRAALSGAGWELSGCLGMSFPLPWAGGAGPAAEPGLRPKAVPVSRVGGFPVHTAPHGQASPRLPSAFATR